MRRIGVLSDTHGVVPPQVFSFFKDCDELWHAGDIGPGVLEELRAFKPVRAVWGNCDSFALHYELEEVSFFEVEGKRVLSEHQTKIARHMGVGPAIIPTSCGGGWSWRSPTSLFAVTAIYCA